MGWGVNNREGTIRVQAMRRGKSGALIGQGQASALNKEIKKRTIKIAVRISEKLISSRTINYLPKNT